MFRFALPIVVTLLLGTPVHAQDDKTGEVDKIFGWATPATPGCVSAVSQHGKIVLNRAYGSADLERDVPLSPSSIFDIGSVRKQFVAAAVLLLVQDGRLALADDVRAYFPELPDYGHTITVNHLLTHTSGIRDWTGLLPLAGGDPDVLSLILRQRGLNFAPGEEWSYSNSGYVLLTELVSRRSGMTFAEFARKRIFEPLGMKSTSARDDLREVVKKRALAYEKAGAGWRLGMLVGNERGSGGGAVLSTAADLAIWNDALTSGRLGTFVTEKLQEPAHLNNGRKLVYARGLIVNPYRGGTLMSHSGGAGGYSSWLGRIPEQGLSIAVLCNEDETSATDLARRVADQFLPAEASNGNAPPAVTAGAGAAVVDLAGKAGLFFSERAGSPLRLAESNGRLQIVGGPVLTPAGTDRFRNPHGDLFFLSQDEFELHFLSANQFELISMEGKTTRYRRAEPVTPTESDLQALAGRYQSEEIGGFLDVAPGKDGLVGRANDAPGAGIEFSPVDRDVFQRRGVILRFLRDQNGNVVALEYSNPVVRNVRFARLGGPSARRE